jgi:hypothetical protein
LQIIKKLYKVSNNAFVNNKSKKYYLYLFKNKKNNIKTFRVKFNKYTKRLYIKRLKIKRHYYGKLKYNDVKFYLNTVENDKTNNKTKSKKPTVYVSPKKALIKRQTDSVLSSIPKKIRINKAFYFYFFTIRKFRFLKNKKKTSKLVPHLLSLFDQPQKKKQPKKRIFFRKKDKEYEELKAKSPALYDMLFSADRTVDTETLYKQPIIKSVRTKINNNLKKKPLGWDPYFTKNFKQYLTKLKNSKIFVSLGDNSVIGFFNKIQSKLFFNGFNFD